MAFQRRIVAYVSYSEDTEDFLRIGLIHYSQASFAFSIEYLEDLTKDTLNTKQKRLIEKVKTKFKKPEKTDDTENKKESLGGNGNTYLRDQDGNIFFGYIFSIQYGQKAMDWFATRAILLPTKKELQRQDAPEGMEKGTDEYNEYIQLYSKKTNDELYDELGIPVSRPASKFQKEPVYTTKAPTKEVLTTKSGKSPTPGKTAVEKTSKITGIPLSTSKAKKVTLKEAMDVVFDAILSGEIGDDYEYSKEYDPEEGEEKRVAYAVINRLVKKKEFADKNGYENRDDVPEMKGPSFFFLIKSTPSEEGEEGEDE